MGKDQAAVGEGDVSMVENDVQSEKIVTDSFSSTPTSSEEGTRQQQCIAWLGTAGDWGIPLQFKLSPGW